MLSFSELAASRRAWIDEVLRPWCEEAPRRDLVEAEAEWVNFAGQVDADATLWAWAWGRFPALVHPEMPGVNETYEVRVELRDGRHLVGFPDSRATRHGKLVLWADGSETEPVSIDDIAGVERV